MLTRETCRFPAETRFENVPTQNRVKASCQAAVGPWRHERNNIAIFSATTAVGKTVLAVVARDTAWNGKIRILLSILKQIVAICKRPIETTVNTEDERIVVAMRSIVKRPIGRVRIAVKTSTTKLWTETEKGLAKAAKRQTRKTAAFVMPPDSSVLIANFWCRQSVEIHGTIIGKRWDLSSAVVTFVGVMASTSSFIDYWPPLIVE